MILENNVKSGNNCDIIGISFLYFDEVQLN